jgi:CheY-like chemotaxis protein
VPQGHREVVLVVEDETALRTALTEILELLNYQTLEAANGQEAMTMLAAQGKHIDLVLSDIIMPEMGGMALLHALRARGWHRPVILLTGHPMDQTLEDLRAQGVAAWLTKPPSFEQLAQVVADALQFKAS